MTTRRFGVGVGCPARAPHALEPPKPLHPLCGRPCDALPPRAVGVDVRSTAVVVGHGAEQVTTKITEQSPPSLHVTFGSRACNAAPATPSASAHGVPCDDEVDEARPSSCSTATCRCCSRQTMPASWSITRRRAPAGTVLTARSPTHGHGRIVRGKENRLIRIVEQRDATP